MNLFLFDIPTVTGLSRCWRNDPYSPTKRDPSRTARLWLSGETWPFSSWPMPWIALWVKRGGRGRFCSIAQSLLCSMAPRSRLRSDVVRQRLLPIRPALQVHRQPQSPAGNHQKERHEVSVRQSARHRGTKEGGQRRDETVRRTRVPAPRIGLDFTLNVVPKIRPDRLPRLPSASLATRSSPLWAMSTTVKTEWSDIFFCMTNATRSKRLEPYECLSLII